MRVLLDENIDRRLKQTFDSDFEVVTVTEHGWNGIKNSELLRAAEAEFDALVTMERFL
jgi:predicted nuclease of predicted toxin-antitoxin system